MGGVHGGDGTAAAGNGAAAAGNGAAAAGNGAGGDLTLERQSTFRRRPSSFGAAAKALCDACIDECGEAQHLVSAIERCKADAAAAREGDARSPTFWMRRGEHYLERYAMLVVFTAYCLKEARGGGMGGGFRQPFNAWLHGRWQLTRVISSLTLD